MLAAELTACSRRLDCSLQLHTYSSCEKPSYGTLFAHSRVVGYDMGIFRVECSLCDSRRAGLCEPVVGSPRPASPLPTAILQEEDFARQQRAIKFTSSPAGRAWRALFFLSLAGRRNLARTLSSLLSHHAEGASPQTNSFCFLRAQEQSTTSFALAIRQPP